MARRFGFLVNSDACSGCKTCQVACKDKNDLPAGIHWRKVYEVVAGGWEKAAHAWSCTVAAYNLSMSCTHCLQPVCIPACSPEAIWQREDGVVLIDESLCTRCRQCEHVCPYLAITFEPFTRKIGKCDFCVDFLDRGLRPACVTACPNRALDYGELEDLKKEYGDKNRTYPLADSSIAQPALVIVAHRDTSLVESREPEVANWEEL